MGAPTDHEVAYDRKDPVIHEVTHTSNLFSQITSSEAIKKIKLDLR